MSVISSMTTAISGLEANGQELAVVSDNIVNANTTGFKSSRGEFHNILAQDLSSSVGGGQIGRGVELKGITGLFTQGSITKTDRPEDLAMQGNGFFILQGDKRGQTFTRDGSFRFDKAGWLTALNGERVQAYQADVDGVLTGRIGDIRIPYKTTPARPTNNIQLHVNLDARDKIQQPLDLNRPEETAGFSTSTQIFDSVGNAHAVNVHFNKTSESGWEWYAMVDGSDLAGGEAGKQTVMAHGALNFDPQGRLASVDQNIVNSNFSNGAIPDQKLYFDFGDAIEKGGTGAQGTTQYGSKNASFRNQQDGFAAGMFTGTSIDENGIINAIFTNGQNKTIGQVALARFESTEKLGKIGANQFAETIGSGQPLIGKSNTNGFGSLMTHSLEQSNVDIAKEFVDMIKAQRGFQASAKSISSANEMLDEVIKLARS